MARLKSLGKKEVTTAGTPVRATATDTWCESFMVEPWIGNTGKTYVGTSASDFGSGNTYLLGIMPIPTTNVVEPFNSGKGSQGNHSFNLADIYIDADVNGEAVLITYTS